MVHDEKNESDGLTVGTDSAGTIETGFTHAESAQPESTSPESAQPVESDEALEAESLDDAADVEQRAAVEALDGSSVEIIALDGAVLEDAAAGSATEAGTADVAQEATVEQASADAAPVVDPLRATTTILFLEPDLPPLLEPELPEHDAVDSPAEAGSARRRSRRRGGNAATEDEQSYDEPSDRFDSRDRPDGRDRFEGRERSGGRTRSSTRDRGFDRDRVDRGEREREKPPVELITEPQRIKGSTRLEAKKQRRRDGRDAGRRRTVVTESEFLARREAVERTMIVRSKGGKIQLGVLEDGVLAEHYVARSAEASLIGNVYLGRVQNVLPSMEAAFVDIGRGRNAVLYSGEVDWDAADTGNQPRRIELALKGGDQVLVQVTKDPVGHKGARLTSQISLPGRYLVYVPNGSMNGISRKLPDTERARLKRILKEVLPDSSGVIVRTAAEGATQEQLTLDVNRLVAQWESLSTKAAKQNAPQLLHSEPDMLIKIVRDVFNEDFSRMVIAGDDARETITEYLQGVAPDLVERIETFEGEGDIFDSFRVTEQIDKALERKVWLPSGGSLVIDRTEAMTVVDVNTGKFVGSGGNLEETVTKNNLEAAEEIVRQLRLRDIGGIIVVDFIDMVLETNRDLVLRRLVECLSRDRTKHQVAEVTSLGLIQMTRKKLGLGLLESFSEPCEVCAGRGIVIQHDPVSRHRAPLDGGSSSNGNGRNNRRGKTTGTSSGQPVTQPHAITDDAKNALAKIAASTLHALSDDSAPSAPAVEPEVVAEVLEATTEILELPAPAPAAILDLPVPPAAPARRSRRVSSTDAELLLGSVLDALPEPKKPGEGRSRSRRVTTQALPGNAQPPMVQNLGDKG